MADSYDLHRQATDGELSELINRIEKGPEGVTAHLELEHDPEAAQLLARSWERVERGEYLVPEDGAGE